MDINIFYGSKETIFSWNELLCYTIFILNVFYNFILSHFEYLLDIKTFFLYNI